MTTTQITIHASRRAGHGKGPARRTRDEGKIPAIVYGPGEAGQSISVSDKDVKAILNSPNGRNTVVTLDIDGNTSLAMLKTFDHHALTRKVTHADFYTVKLDRRVEVPVPFLLIGKSKGVAIDGGVLRQIFRTLTVRCTPDKIPAKLEGDVTNLGLGESLHVRDLVLPEGVTVALDPSQTIASVAAPEKEDIKAAEATAAKDAKPAAKDAKPAPAKKK